MTPPDDSPAGAGTRRFTRGLAGAALLIGVITVVARIAGLGRSLSFSHTVGNDCLSTAYLTGNQVTNIVFEVVIGGALASMVVPLLAGPAERGSDDARRIASALLTWTVVILLPVSVLAGVLAEPIMTLLAGQPRGCSSEQVVDVGTRMLVIFAPQILFYGLAVVAYGILQAHRRFLSAALAPLISSLIVISAYVSFIGPGGAYRASQGNDLSILGRDAELVLSVGTTLGVVALVATVAWPLARLRLRLRPTLRFPPGVGIRLRRLAMAGLATLLAQQAAWTVVILLANEQGGAGAFAIYHYAWALFQLPYAVLAVPLATSAFPVLSARAGDENPAEFDRTAASTTRAVVLLSCAGAAVLAATALPLARVFLIGAGGGQPPADLALAIVAFAPGLVGYGLIAHVGRALYAAGHGRVSALAQVTGWLIVMAAEVALAVSVERSHVVAVLGLGNSIGLTVGGVLLVVMLVRTRGRAAVAGLARALAAGVLGAAGAYAAGAGVVAAFGHAGLYSSAGIAVLAALASASVFALVAFLIDGQDLRAVLRRRQRKGVVSGEG